MPKKKYLSIVLLAGIFAAGILLRVWDFGNHPAGLNQDEASIGVEAASLYHFGADRNGDPFPVQLTSWGSGQNVLYAYLLAPLTPLGMTAAVVRFPMLLSGILSIGLMYLIGRKMFSEPAGILMAFLMAISPWNVMLSRWALESNIFPFVFMLGFLFLIHYDRSWLFVLIGCLFLGISLYAYGTAYFIVPLFLLFVFGILIIRRVISWPQLAACLTLTVLLSLPIGLFLAVNMLSLPAIHIGPLTIPHLPAPPRLFMVSAAGSTSLLKYFFENTAELLRILILQKDGLLYNSLPAFGFLFSGAFLLALGGGGKIIREAVQEKKPAILFLLGWVFLALILGIIQEPNINRVNILFPPLIILVGITLAWLFSQNRMIFFSILGGIFLSEAVFAYEYFGQQYRNNMGMTFYDGIIPALESIPSGNSQPVCITSAINMPYIYVLLVHPEQPSLIQQNIHYQNPGDAFQAVDQYRNYYFGLSNCPTDTSTYWILPHGDSLPEQSQMEKYSIDEYGYFDLYRPR